MYTIQKAVKFERSMLRNHLKTKLTSNKVAVIDEDIWIIEQKYLKCKVSKIFEHFEMRVNPGSHPTKHLDHAKYWSVICSPPCSAQLCDPALLPEQSCYLPAELADWRPECSSAEQPGPPAGVHHTHTLQLQADPDQPPSTQGILTTRNMNYNQLLSTVEWKSLKNVINKFHVI